MVTALSIIALALFAAISYHVGRSIIYPPFAMAACWAALLGLHACSRPYLFPIHDETVLFYVVGALAFCGGGLFVHYFRRPRQLSVHYDPDRVRKVLDALLLALLVATPFYWRFVTDLVSAGPSGSFWVILRQQLIEESSESVSRFSLMDNMVVVANLAVVIAWYHRGSQKWRSWLAFGFFLFYNALTAGRAGFVFVLCCLFTIEILRIRRIPWRAIAIFAFIFVIVFFGIAILGRKAGASTEASVSENTPLLIEGFELYTLGPIVAFDNIYQHPSYIPPTQNVDRNFKIAFNKLGYRTEVPYLHAAFSTVGPSGVDMNAYTIYFSYFPQLGAVGSIVIMLALGAGVTWAYCSALGGGPRAVVIFAILFHAILLSGYAEYYFGNLNFLGKMLILTFICYGLPFKRSQAIPC